MTTIPTLPRGVSDCVAAFDLAAIAITRDNRLAVTRNPAGMTLAWWCQAKQASAIVRRARRDSGDVEAAARALGVPVGEHHTAMQRAADAVSQIDAALTDAQQRGLLVAFNKEYRQRREAAVLAGRGFMSYGRARSRLRKAIAGIIALGGSRRDLDLEAIRRVFEAG